MEENGGGFKLLCRYIFMNNENFHQCRTLLQCCDRLSKYQKAVQFDACSNEHFYTQ